MKTTTNTSRLSVSALSIAAAVVGAVSFVPHASASALDPADPYQYTAGQYPAMQQSFGLAPQYTGEESMGMRQARIASGQTGAGIYQLAAGSNVSVGSEGTAPTSTMTTSTSVAANVSADEVAMSPVQRAIHRSLHTIATTKGAAAVADSSDIAPTFQNAPYDSHSLLGVYQQRVQTSSNAIESLQARSAQFAGDTQANFNTAMQDVTNSRAQLDQDFSAAYSATPANWDQVRSSLAVDYKRYSDAVAKAEAIGHGTPSS